MIKLKKLLCGTLCIASVAITVSYGFSFKESSSSEEKIQTLTLWQIDGFEGGTGSRTAYLQEVGNNYKKLGNEYINVISISAEAARLNISNGNSPDIISFSGGEWGLESIINANYKINCWCYGSYCLLTLNSEADFSTANAQNTVINIGKDNLSSAAALLSGLSGAATQSPTYAYVDLINCKYEFLLGTQRDIYRLNARKVNYSVQVIEEFNDLYQLIAVCSTDIERVAASGSFIEYLINNNSDVYKLGLLGGKTGKNEKIDPLEGKTYKLTINYPISSATREQLEQAISLKDINKLKMLLK